MLFHHRESNPFNTWIGGRCATGTACLVPLWNRAAGGAESFLAALAPNAHLCARSLRYGSVARFETFQGDESLRSPHEWHFSHFIVLAAPDDATYGQFCRPRQDGKCSACHWLHSLASQEARIRFFRPLGPNHGERTLFLWAWLFRLRHFSKFEL